MKLQKEMEKNNWNNYRDEALTIAQNHGWHDEELSNEHCLMLIITEISEAVEADRKCRHAEKSSYEHDTMRALRDMQLSGEAYRNYETSCFNCYIKDSVEDELADVVIRCLDLAGLRNINLNGISTRKPSTIPKRRFTEFAFFLTKRIFQYPNKEDLWYTIREMFSIILPYCELMNIDIEWFVKHKMEYNKTRAYKHGKKY